MPALERLSTEMMSKATSQYQSLALSQTMAVKSQTDRLNDIDVLFPMVKLVTLVIVVPVILMLIYRSERKHVKYDYQLASAKKALVRLDCKST